jgi:hypothetical protein
VRQYLGPSAARGPGWLWGVDWSSSADGPSLSNRARASLHEATTAAARTGTSAVTLVTVITHYALQSGRSGLLVSRPILLLSVRIKRFNQAQRARVGSLRLAKRAVN